MRCGVLSEDTRPLTEVIVLHRLRWLERALLIPADCLLFRALFPRTGQGCKKRRGGKAVTCRRGMKKLVSVLV